jgi:hypothetical protein
MTLSEVLLVVAASSVTTWIITSIMTSIADPAQRREMGVRLQGDTEDLEREIKEALNKITDEELYSLCVEHELSKDKKSQDNGYTKPDIDADEF